MRIYYTSTLASDGGVVRETDWPDDAAMRDKLASLAEVGGWRVFADAAEARAFAATHDAARVA